MARITTPRLGLQRWTAGSDTWDRADFDGNAVLLDSLVAIDLPDGTLAARPAAAVRGRYYRATDTGRLYRDNGATWDIVSILGDDGLPRWPLGPFSALASALTGAYQPLRLTSGIGELPAVAAAAGSITGVSVALLAARTAGSITVEVHKNGAATGLLAVLDATNPQYSRATQAAGLDTFAPGDRLDVRALQSAFTPTTGSNTLAATIWVQR